MFTASVHRRYEVRASDLTIIMAPFANEKGNGGTVESGAFSLRAEIDGKEVGFANFYREYSQWFVFEVHVEKDFRRQKIATTLYDAADEMTGTDVLPQVLDHNINEPCLEPEAFLLWIKRRPYLKQDILEAVTDDCRADLEKALKKHGISAASAPVLAMELWNEEDLKPLTRSRYDSAVWKFWIQKNSQSEHPKEVATCRVDGQLVGWCGVSPYTYKPTKRPRTYPDTVGLISTFVRDDHRRQGLAGKLAEMALKQFKKEHPEITHIMTAHKPNVALIEKMGWTPLVWGELPRST